MFTWLPEVARDIRGNLLEIYWVLILPLVLLLIVVEFFRIPEKNIGAGNIIKRAAISMLLLASFDEVVNLIAIVSDGVTEKIEGATKLMNLMDTLKDKYTEYQGSVFDLRESIIFFFNLLAYIIAYLGVFVSNALIHFVFGILYCISPLMILMYCSERTSFICSNLYKGLLSVMSWKILWSILGVLLLKLATSSEVGNWENVFTSIIINLCIGVSMLLIPFFAKSLLSDGLVNAASGLAAAPALAGIGAAKAYATKKIKSSVRWSGNQLRNHVGRPLWKHTGGVATKEMRGATRFVSEIGRVDKASQLAKRSYEGIKTRVDSTRRSSADWIRVKSGLNPKHRVQTPRNVIKVDFRNRRPKK